MSFYYFEVVRGTESGKRFLLSDGAISIGRNSQNAISFPTEKMVSSHHAIIYKTPERILMQDMQSANGSFVNDLQIAEQEIIPGDIIGMGKSGPRLKLITSETELPLTTATTPPTDDKTEIKKNNNLIIDTNDMTVNEDQNLISKMKIQSKNESSSSSSFNPSMTMEYEKKIAENRIDSNEMHKLMSDSKRIEKIIENGKLDESQHKILETMYHANKKMKQTWFYVISVILLISGSVSVFFGIRAFQYKQLFSNAQKLQKDIQDYDKKIASVNENPDQNKEELIKLIAELEKKQKDFNELSSKLNQNDFVKIYSDPLEKRIDGILVRYGETNYHIPQEMVDRVSYHIDIYSKNLKKTISHYIKRKEKYFPMIHKVFREKNLPIELAYVSMLESGFNPMALSHAGARGLWQFMPETGRRYGLTVTDQIDDRTDPEKATYAAAEFFKDLIGVFGGKSSVMLCMAAYNTGEGNVMRALRKIDDPMRNRDFWYIYRMGYLPDETMEYIPRVIALMIISENPRDYGFEGHGAPIDEKIVNSEKDFIDFRVK
jgi:pSer/pThr/pTyr-binding forkhead associated (FHA) protein